MWNGIGEEPRPARPTPFGETGEVRRKTGEAVVSWSFDGFSLWLL